jgi:hypothetical protein
MSLNEADLWASRLKRLHDDRMIELEVECPSRDWDALMYLVGVDMQTAPGVYLHTIQDIETALFRFFPEYFINRINEA